MFNVTLFLTVNVRKPPFNDPRVRRALSLAIDRQGGLEGLKRVAAVDFLTVLVPPGGISDYSKEEMDKLSGFGGDIEARRAEAKKLLAEAGVPNLKLTLLNRNVRQPWQPVGVFVMDQWRQIGIEVNQIPAETPQYFAAITSGNYDVALDFNNTVSVDPNETLIKFVPGNPNNYSGADDSILVDLYDKQVVTENPDERRKLVRQFLDRMMDQLYSIPLIRSNRTTAVLKEVKGWKTPPTTVLNLDLADIWIDKLRTHVGGIRAACTITVQYAACVRALSGIRSLCDQARDALPLGVQGLEAGKPVMEDRLLHSRRLVRPRKPGSLSRSTGCRVSGVDLHQQFLALPARRGQARRHVHRQGLNCCTRRSSTYRR